MSPWLGWQRFGVWLLAVTWLGVRAESLAGRDGFFPSTAWQTRLDAAVEQTVARTASKPVTSDELAVTLVDLSDADRPAVAHHRGGELIYPASVVKLFYLVAAHRWMEDGRLADTPELRRALRDMIVESYNEATHYVVDVLTGTTSGPELSDEALAQWAEQRNAVNRYFQGQGYPDINANKKPWCEGPYGRETQAMARYRPSRNLLSTDATARLVVEIFTDRAVTPDRSRQMRELMVRRLDPGSASADPDGEGAGYTGRAVLRSGPPGVKLWSKAGWTSQTRHDAAYLELPDGRKLVLVIFTTGHGNERDLLPALAARVLGWPVP